MTFFKLCVVTRTAGPALNFKQNRGVVFGSREDEEEEEGGGSEAAWDSTTDMKSK